MKLTVDSSTLQKRGTTDVIRDQWDALRGIHEAGFDGVDLAFHLYKNVNHILRYDDWQEKVEKVGRTAEELGMVIYQCHAPFVRGVSDTAVPNLHDPDQRAYYEEICRRAMIAAGMLGVKWIVQHPLTFPEYNYEHKATFDANHEFYDKFVELAAKNGVGTAFENQLPSLKRKFAHRYCSHYEELIEFVDSYNDPMVGICWDSGHANQMGFDQKRGLHCVGSRLKCLHLNDNVYGTMDEHLLPYMGDIDWPSLVDALVEIDYQGTLNFEVKSTVMADGEIQKNLLKMTYVYADHIRKMYEAAKLAKGK